MDREDSSALPDLAAWAAWLHSINLSFEDALRLVARAVAHAPNGGTVEDVRAYFAAVHGGTLLSEDRARDLLRAAQQRGLVRELARDRYASALDDRPRVHALVSVPLDEWARVEQYAHNGRAAWIAGHSDHA